jgi:hypothetical protein
MRLSVSQAKHTKSLINAALEGVLGEFTIGRAELLCHACGGTDFTGRIARTGCR